MSSSVRRRPAAALALAALLSAGLAAPAAASPWSDAWSRLTDWFAATPLGALWADGGTRVGPHGGPRQVVGHEGMGIDPSGRPAAGQGSTSPEGPPQR